MTAPQIGAPPPETVRGAWRLLLPALAAWAVTALAIVNDAATVTIATLAVAVTSGLAVWRVRHRATLRTVLLGVTLAAVLSALITARLDPPAESDASTPQKHAQAVSFDAQVYAYPRAGWVDVTGPGRAVTRVWLKQPLPSHIAPLTPVKVSGTLTPQPRTSFQRFTLEHATVRERPGPLNPAQQFFQHLAQLRHDASAAAQRHPWGSLVPGFAYGDTDAVPKELEAAMRESSLTHLTAVSGANCALVIAAAVLVLPGRRIRYFGAATALLGFVALVGPDASVLRAACMAGVLLLSRFGGRQGTGFHALGLAVAVLLIATPQQAFAPGFTLSVLSTLGIMLIGNRLTATLTGWRVPLALALPTAVAVAAQLSVAPVLLLLQPGVSLAGVPANILAAPFAPIGTALGLCGTLTLPFVPTLSELAFFGAAVAARGVEAIAFTAAQLPFGRLDWPGGVGGSLLLAACELLCVTAWALHRNLIATSLLTPRQTLWPAPRSREPFWRTFVVTVCAAGAAALLAGVTVVTPTVQRLAVPADWEIAACDVDQGDGLVMRDHRDPRSVIVIDTGEHPELLRNCLELLGVSHVAAVFLSHDDMDHVGAVEVLEGRTHEAVISPPSSEELVLERKLTDRLHALDIRPTVAMLGDRFSVVDGRLTAHQQPHSVDEIEPVHGPPHGFDEPAAEGGLATEALLEPPHPERVKPMKGLSIMVLAPLPSDTFEDENASSLIMRVDTAHTSALFLGDTGLTQQRQLGWRVAPEWLHVDVLKVAHHGSKDADHSLPKIAGARFGLVSCGAHNSYGHPTVESLESLLRAGTRPLRTDRLGTVVVTARLQAWAADPQKHSRESAIG